MDLRIREDDVVTPAHADARRLSSERHVPRRPPGRWPPHDLMRSPGQPMRPNPSASWPSRRRAVSASRRSERIGPATEARMGARITGEELAGKAVADADGYAALAEAIGDPDGCAAVGVEGTQPCGAGLVDEPRRRGFRVPGVPGRSAKTRGGGARARTTGQAPSAPRGTLSPGRRRRPRSGAAAGSRRGLRARPTTRNG